jgi:hypothetical protein
MYEATIAYWLIKILNYSGVNPYKVFSYRSQGNKIREPVPVLDKLINEEGIFLELLAWCLNIFYQEA